MWGWRFDATVAASVRSCFAEIRPLVLSVRAVVSCGLIDMVLLASTLMTPGAALWTLDKRLRAFAERLEVLHRTVQK
jgi:hypothetical protein